MHMLSCISSPSHCVFGQQKGLICDVLATQRPPRLEGEKWSTHQQNHTPPPNRSFFWRGLFSLAILGSPSSCSCFMRT